MLSLADFTERHARAIKWLGIIFLAPGAILCVVMMIMIGRSVYLHDETRCPFHHVGARQVAPGETVVEEVRRCQSGIEERRWVLDRPGKKPAELGRRRLARRLYDTPRYRWKADVERGRVHVVVHNPGIPDDSFRERIPWSERGRLAQPSGASSASNGAGR